MSSVDEFSIIDYVPDDLDEQTKILLRLTMESPLTANVSRCLIRMRLVVEPVRRKALGTFMRTS
jgi:hypothetical protein